MIRGGERLGWDQPARSLAEVRAHTFTLFVDGARNALLDVQCNDGSSGRYPCSGRLPTMTPGRHTLELGASWNGVESARSSALVVQLASSQASAAAPALVPAAGAVTCMDENECYDVSTVTQGNAEIAWLSAASDGRLFYVENQRFLRVVVDDVALPEPALALEPSIRIAGLALDPKFASTRLVFVAWIDLRTDPAELHVTRYRELQNVLGEAATIVTGIPVPEQSSAPLAVTRDGFVYVAVPSHHNPQGSAHAYNGHLLRFTMDGRVPDVNRGASPIVAIGFDQPTALAVSPRGASVWLAGRRKGWDFGVASIPVHPDADAAWPATPLPGGAFGPGDLRLAFLHTDTAPHAVLHVIADPSVFRMERTTRELRLTGIERPLAVTEGQNGSRYVAAAGPGAFEVTLLRLARRR